MFQVNLAKKATAALQKEYGTIYTIGSAPDILCKSLSSRNCGPFQGSLRFQMQRLVDPTIGPKGQQI